MSILDEAKAIISGERREDYGHPLDNHTATAEAWRVYLRRRYDLDVPLDAEDVCLLNILQKVVREAHSRKRDNLVDIVGFTGNIELVQQERRDRGLGS